jgi:hypothetical protein
MADLNLHVIKDNTISDAARLNANSSNVEKTAAQKATLAAALSDGANNITANVNSWVGNYVKVAFLKNNKAYGSWETYGYTDTTKALAALTVLKTQG